MPEIGSSLSSTRTIYGGIAETGFALVVFSVFCFSPHSRFPLGQKIIPGCFAEVSFQF